MLILSFLILVVVLNFEEIADTYKAAKQQL